MAPYDRHETPDGLVAGHERQDRVGADRHRGARLVRDPNHRAGVAMPVDRVDHLGGPAARGDGERQHLVRGPGGRVRRRDLDPGGHRGRPQVRRDRHGREPRAAQAGDEDPLRDEAVEDRQRAIGGRIGVEERRQRRGPAEDVVEHPARAGRRSCRRPPRRARASPRSAPTSSDGRYVRRRRTRSTPSRSRTPGSASGSTTIGAPASRSPARYASRNRSRARRSQPSRSSPGASSGPPLRACARRSGASPDVVERAEHRGDVAQRRPWRPTLVGRAQRLALEVDDAIAVGGDEHLAQVVVPWIRVSSGARRERVEDRERLGDPRRELAEQRARPPRRSTSSALDRAASRRVRRTSAEARRGSRPVARSSGTSRARREGRVQPGRERPEVGGDLGRELDAHLARREQPGGQRLGDRLVDIRAVGDEGLGDGDGGDAVAGRDDLGVAGQRRDRREPGLLGQDRRRARAPGSDPAGARRYALSSTASPSTTEVLDWSAPRSRSTAGRDARWHRPPGTADERRRRPAPTRSPSASTSGAPRSSDRRPSRPPAPATHRRPGSAGRSGSPVRANGYAIGADRRRARSRAIARTCGPPASRTKASSSVTSSIVRPLSPNQRAAARSARSRPRRAPPRPRDSGLPGGRGHRPTLGRGTVGGNPAGIGWRRRTRASIGSGPGVDHHVLDERVVLERVLGAVLAPAGLLDAAVRRLRREREVLVDPDVAELERLGDPHRPCRCRS